MNMSGLSDFINWFYVEKVNMSVLTDFIFYLVLVFVFIYLFLHNIQKYIHKKYTQIDFLIFIHI